MNFGLLLGIILTVVSCYNCNELEELDSAIKKRIRKYNITQSFPEGFKRLYLDWKRNSSSPEKLTSYEIESVQRRNQKYHMQYPLQRNKALKSTKVEFWIEIYGVPKMKPENQTTYITDMRAYCKKTKSRPLERGASFIKDDFAHFSYDITELHSELKALNVKRVQFKMRLRKLKKGVTEFPDLTVKSFIVFYEEEKNFDEFNTNAIGPRFNFIPNQAHRLWKFPNKYLKSADNPKSVKACALKYLDISLEKNFFDEFVIAPLGASIHTCRGSCNTPRAKSTTHALIQVVLSLMGHSSPPCCVPTAWDPIVLVLFDHFENMFVIKKFPDAVATDCGCL